MAILLELIDALKNAQIEARFDLPTRILYSTDASIYQIAPLGVAFPKSLDELAGTVELAASFDIPVLARGSGSSLGGQAIGHALILDCSRYLTRILEINPEDRSAVVEPGVILSSLNKAAAKFGLQFGPDPASAERATMGGSLANNATGAHSILYGMAADHIVSADVVLADGSITTFAEVTLEQARRIAGEVEEGLGDGGGHTSLSPISYPLVRSIYGASLRIREQYSGAIQARWPDTWRRAAGYNLNYLLPWTPASPLGWNEQFVNDRQPGLSYPPVSPGSLNLSQLLVGSEGTLAVIGHAKVRLVPLPKHTVLCVLAFSEIAKACDAVSWILELGPSAVELIPGILVNLARGVSAYASQLSIFDQLTNGSISPDLLVVEFSGDDPARLRERIDRMKKLANDSIPIVIAESNEAQKQVWSVRKVGLGLLSSRAGDVRSTAFIEDLSVPVVRLGDFVRELQHIFQEHNTVADFYAHASAGCLHIRPMVNLKTVEGVKALRSIAEQAVQLTVRLNGSVSGEHGLGIARSEWLGQMYRDEIMSAFRILKDAADPKGLLNPGKILDAPRMDENLRYGAAYSTYAWTSEFDFSSQGGLAGAIEMCNGAGVCRKQEGVMCPSFQATREEMHSTRGRANLLREMISLPADSRNFSQVSDAVYEALDLCLACKGCKAECPSSVDMAKLRYEFLHQYYQTHRRKIRDYLFAFIGVFARLGHHFSAVVNPLLGWESAKNMAEKWLGFSAKRQFPILQQKSFHRRATEVKVEMSKRHKQADVFLLSDPFIEYFQPEIGLAAVRVLHALGYQVGLLPVIGSGRTLISKGFLPAARRHASRLVETVDQMDPDGQIPVIGLEPSEIYTLRDEYFDLLPGDQRVQRLADRSWMIDEFLVRPGGDGLPRINRLLLNESTRSKKVYLHGHCYQKSQPLRPDGRSVGEHATRELLALCGYDVAVIEGSCCGMAGAFGYEAEHYDLSMQVGELSLFPGLRAAGVGIDHEMLIVAAGVSCQAQIKDGVGRTALHPIQLLAQLLEVD